MIKKFFGSPFGVAIGIMAGIDGVATAVLIFNDRADWTAGIWISAAWFVVNAFLMWRIMEWVASGGIPDRRRILGWCVIKFPVLYLVGLVLLIIPGVRASGVLVTFTAFLIGLTVSQVLNIGKKP